MNEEELRQATDLSNELKDFILKNYPVGTIVKREPTWNWGNQDHNRSGKQVSGTVVEYYSRASETETYWITVKWDRDDYEGMLPANQYRVSRDKILDIVPIDPLYYLKQSNQLTLPGV